MKWIGTQTIYDSVRFKRNVDFSEDVTFYQPVNNANPGISIGANDDERLLIYINYQGTTTQLAQQINFVTYTESATANDGEMQFFPDEVKVLAIDDGGIDFEANKGISINGTDILTDSSGAATLSNIDALDATTIATFEEALETNIDTLADITLLGSNIINTDRSAAQGNAGAENITALHVDFDRTSPESGTYAHNDIGINLDVNSASLGTSSLMGMDIDVRGATSGTSTATGIDLLVSGADTNIGIQVLCEGEQLRLSHNAADYATFTVADTGDLTIATVGDGSRDSDLTLDANGQIKLEPDSGSNILLDGTIAIDAGVVTGATSITSTAFVGDVTGNVSGTAGTVTTSAQPNIESIGTDGDLLQINGDILAMTNSSTTMPLIQLQNTTDDAFGPRFVMRNQRGGSAGADNDEVGKISFEGYDDQGTPAIQTYARILGEIHDATSGEESGRLTLEVANHDGGLGSGLILTGGAADNSVNVDIGLGEASIVTVPGTVVVEGATIDIEHASGKYRLNGVDILSDSSGTATLSNIDAIDATTATTFKAALYSNSIISFLGQATMDSDGNWMMPGKAGISNHTWNLDSGVNTEDNGTSEASIDRRWAHAGIRMPFACIVDGMSCMISNASGNRQVTVGLFFARAADGTTAPTWGADTGNVSAEPILQIHADANNESGSYTGRPAHAEVTGSNIAMAAGDVFYPAIKLTGVTSSGNTDNVYASFSIHIKTLLT